MYSMPTPKGLNFRKAFLGMPVLLVPAVVYGKRTPSVLGRSPYQWQHEPVLFGWKKKGKHQWYTGRKETTIWNLISQREMVDHPTMKPIPLLAYPILNSSHD